MNSGLVFADARGRSLTSDEADAMRETIQSAVARADGQCVVILSTEGIIRQAAVEHIRKEWERATEGLHNPPRLAVIQGMRVNVIGDCNS